MKITAKRDHHFFKIYFGKLPHLIIKMEDFIGLQSWIDNENLYVIEFHMKNGNILSEYVNKNHWEKILKLLDEIIY